MNSTMTITVILGIGLVTIYKLAAIYEL